MSVSALVDAVTLELVIAAFAGGAFGAALGALPAFIFTGFMVIAGEMAAFTGADPAGNVTGLIGFGPVFGPHVSFAGGAAAAAYAARRGEMDTGFDYHEGKNILYALGTKPDILAVGGLFGILGMLIRQTSFAFTLPWDPIAMGVTLSALFHRLILGYPLIGRRDRGLLNMTPFEDEIRRGAVGSGGTGGGGGEAATDGGMPESERLLVEPWLPHQYRWGHVATIGLIVGILGGYTALVTQSAFLAFGISAATLVFLNCGVEQIPVTHHMSLTGSTAALGVAAQGDAILSGLGDGPALLVAGVVGMFASLVAELFQRIFYAHSDTHWDPPAAAITITTFVIVLLVVAGVFETAVWVPNPF